MHKALYMYPYEIWTVGLDVGDRSYVPISTLFDQLFVEAFVVLETTNFTMCWKMFLGCNPVNLIN
jgi:hypothetical protein